MIYRHRTLKLLLLIFVTLKPFFVDAHMICRQRNLKAFSILIYTCYIDPATLKQFVHRLRFFGMFFHCCSLRNFLYIYLIDRQSNFNSSLVIHI